MTLQVFVGLKILFSGPLLVNHFFGIGLTCVLLTLSRSLCRAIDPGITFSPCIALCTEERSQVFRRRNQTKRLSKVHACKYLPLVLFCFFSFCSDFKVNFRRKSQFSLPFSLYKSSRVGSNLTIVFQCKVRISSM